MQQKIRGIVLQTVRHNDRHNIVTLYTESHGRVAFLSPASSGKAGRLRNAMLSPLAVVEADVRFSATRDLQYLGSVSTPEAWRNLYFDPDKISMTFFLTDLLTALLRTAPPDKSLFTFLRNAVAMLDALRRGVANFHICFLLRLLPFMGIGPDYESYRPGTVFNMREGTFDDRTPDHHDYLPVAESALIPLFSRMTFDNLHAFQLSVGDRRRILTILMRYYSLHLPVPSRLKSLEILTELYR